ncbi:hypothetical protein [Actinophytocola sp.]|uniref:hypothetical protein n=1 Tax=Actinophytocola sp. TaxID=1872138 RepID=UPI00389A16BB
MTRSAAFERFLAGVTAPVRLTRDSIEEIPHVGAIFDLVGEERIEAEDILIAKLATGDGRAAGALVEACCFRAVPAFEPLRELLGSAEGHARGEIESVLATLTR